MSSTEKNKILKNKKKRKRSNKDDLQRSAKKVKGKNNNDEQSSPAKQPLPKAGGKKRLRENEEPQDEIKRRKVENEGNIEKTPATQPDAGIRGKKRCRNSDEGIARKQVKKMKPACQPGPSHCPTEQPKEPAEECSSYSPISIERFLFHQHLGSGSYGKVMLAMDSVTSQYIAIKTLKKRKLLEEDEREFIMVEHQILQIANECKFLTGLYAAFHNKDYVFYAMEYLPGGSLGELLSARGPLNIETVRFIAAELICGISFLHSKGIVHRDLKPENILLDSVGHIKIADFGLALENMFEGQTATEYAGTPGYIAPEMTGKKKYNASVDWWSYGIILYEMVTGKMPFQSIPKGEIKCLRTLKGDIKDLITKLLRKDPAGRLTDASSMKAHPFFNPIVWEDLEAGRMEPPFSMPRVMITEEVLPHEQVLCSEEEKSPIAKKDQSLFKGFTYVSPYWRASSAPTTEQKIEKKEEEREKEKEKEKEK
ncbi:protein kinase C delta type-like, partial [Xenopus tropicalis]|uniref:Protein kinase C delta type-like n=1 Tax=Xenopus tropicalis TaxID=8364 RepID=A0A8J1JH80_XENTR